MRIQFSIFHGKVVQKPIYREKKKVFGDVENIA